MFLEGESVGQVCDCGSRAQQARNAFFTMSGAVRQERCSAAMAPLLQMPDGGAKSESLGLFLLCEGLCPQLPPPHGRLPSCRVGLLPSDGQRRLGPSLSSETSPPSSRPHWNIRRCRWLVSHPRPLPPPPKFPVVLCGLCCFAVLLPPRLA